MSPAVVEQHFSAQRLPFFVDWGTQLLPILSIGAYRVMARVACLWLVGLAYRCVQPAYHVLWGVLHVYVRHDTERWARRSASSPFAEVVSIGEGVQKGKKLTRKLLSVDEMDGKRRWRSNHRSKWRQSHVGFGDRAYCDCSVGEFWPLNLGGGFSLPEWRSNDYPNIEKPLIWMLEEDTKIL